MNNYKLVLFDVDGTLLDTSEFIFQAFEYCFNKYNLPTIDRSEMCKQMGKNLEHCYSIFTTLDDVSECVHSHKEFQDAHLALSIPYANTAYTLRKIKDRDFRLGIITGRTYDSVLKTLKLAKIDHFFDVVYSPDNITHQKPNPEAVYKALEYFYVKPHEAIIVGDGLVDIQAGKNASIHTVGAAYGFNGDLIKEVNPDYIIHDIRELLAII